MLFRKESYSTCCFSVISLPGLLMPPVRLKKATLRRAFRRSGKFLGRIWLILKVEEFWIWCRCDAEICVQAWCRGGDADELLAALSYVGSAALYDGLECLFVSCKSNSSWVNDRRG